MGLDTLMKFDKRVQPPSFAKFAGYLLNICSENNSNFGVVEAPFTLSRQAVPKRFSFTGTPSRK